MIVAAAESYCTGGVHGTLGTPALAVVVVVVVSVLPFLLSYSRVDRG